MRNFEDINPLVLLFYFVFVSVIPMFFMDIVILIISLLCSFSLFFYNNKFKSKSGYLFSLFLFVVISIINPIFSHNGVTVLFVVNNSPITMEALIYGVASALMIVSILYWFKTFSQIMTGDKIIYIFGKFSQKIALIISMALRYIPLFKKQAEKINKSQMALGAYKEDNIVDSIKIKIVVFSSLITWTLENGIITANSMEARGYGIRKRTFYSDYKIKFSDILFLIISFILFLFTLYAMYFLNNSFYPEFALNTSEVSLFGYFSYSILGITPLLLQIKEDIKWKYSELKI